MRCQGKEDCHTRQSSVQSERERKERKDRKGEKGKTGRERKERQRQKESSCVGSHLKTETFGKKKSHRIGLTSQP